jgi:hypothetical protein
MHVLETGEDPSTEEAADGLTALNDMLDEWNIDRGLVFAIEEDSQTWTGGAQSMTIGSGGDMNTTRPIRIENSTFYTDANGNDYNLRLLETRIGYTSIVDKETTTDLPEYLYYEPDYPLGELYIWPVPSANMTIKLHRWEQFSLFASLDATVTLAPGYKNLVTYGLCEYLAPEFGVAVPPEVMSRYEAASQRIRKNNIRIPIMQAETAAIREGRSFNIFVGD